MHLPIYKYQGDRALLGILKNAKESHVHLRIFEHRNIIGFTLNNSQLEGTTEIKFCI